MALGNSGLFSWKSKETIEREAKEYETWAFPYGQEQRDKLEALVREVVPKGHVPFALMGFLTCKELYEKHLKQTESSDKATDILINVEKKYMQIIKKKEMTTFLALVLADAEIDERCEYPSAVEIHESIEKLEKLRRK